MSRKTKIITVSVLIVFLLAFIWTRSLRSAAESTVESKAIGSFLTPLLELFVGKENVTDHLVRKLAHFCEFSALGFLGVQLLIVCEKVSAFLIGYVWLCSVAAAVIDESLQLFSSNRSAQITDVLLDSAGALFGILIALIVFFAFIIMKRKRQRG